MQSIYSIATVADLLRLVVVPVFAWAAIRDVKTRRLPSSIWPPLVAVGVVALLMDAVRYAPFETLGGRLFVFQVAVSLLFVAPLAYAFWWFGGFGGADAKALMTLAVVVPTVPHYTIGSAVYPIVEGAIGVFSFTILTNTVLLAAVIPLSIAAGNVARGRLSVQSLFARPVRVESVTSRHGQLFETRRGYTRTGLDLDALRMYLRWRGTTLEAIRSDPDAHRDPASIEETFDPTDGATTVGPRTDGGIDTDRPIFDDPWGAEQFLDSIETSAYGTDAETLREGLETLVETETVWVSPGFPFILPMFLGLLVAFTYGDLLFGMLTVVGLA